MLDPGCNALGKGIEQFSYEGSSEDCPLPGAGSLGV